MAIRPDRDSHRVGVFKSMLTMQIAYDFIMVHIVAVFVIYGNTHYKKRADEANIIDEQAYKVC